MIADEICRIFPSLSLSLSLSLSVGRRKRDRSRVIRGRSDLFARQATLCNFVAGAIRNDK